ncbi:proline-rich protein 5 isoform X1 [Arapaima gigas]
MPCLEHTLRHQNKDSFETAEPGLGGPDSSLPVILRPSPVKLCKLAELLVVLVIQSCCWLRCFRKMHSWGGRRTAGRPACSAETSRAMLDGYLWTQKPLFVPRSITVSFATHPAPAPSADMEGNNHPLRRTLHRLKLMSSPSLSELGKSEKAALEERGTQQRRAGANATWNSIHNAVIAVFQKKGLADNELYALNEGVRQLLKTELGSFFTEYLQNQLLTKGMVILRDKIRFYEGQKLLDSLAETWDFFFCDVLSMLQAIFYPVQGKEPSVRQLALLHFRNIITLNIKLEDALSRPRARVPPSIIQMLLILQVPVCSPWASERRDGFWLTASSSPNSDTVVGGDVIIVPVLR